MSDVKCVLALLCRHLSLSVNVSLKPEHFRLAKYNNVDKDLVDALWTVLRVLSFHAVGEKRITVDFHSYDTITAVKLCFAYLQYSMPEFYGLTQDYTSSRLLLLALAWLLSSKKILDTVVREKIVDGILGKESTYFDTAYETIPELAIDPTIDTKINNILYLSGKLNNNIKQVSQLVTEKAKLVTKVHAASLNVSGLPHMNVSELSLTKRFTNANKGTCPEKDKIVLHQLNDIGNLLETHMKWIKKEYIFFDWMVSVAQEHIQSIGNDTEDSDLQTIPKFVSLLHCTIKKKLKESARNNTETVDFSSNFDCPARLMIIQRSDTEIEKWLTDINNRVIRVEEELQKKGEEILRQLKLVLKPIPHCIHI